MREVVSIRFVYCAFWGFQLVTLCATPFESTGRKIELPPEVRDRLFRVFVRWMSLRHPDWMDGPDVGGVLDWDLRLETCTHRHCGYAQYFVQACHHG